MERIYFLHRICDVENVKLNNFNVIIDKIEWKRQDFLCNKRTLFSRNIPYLNWEGELVGLNKDQNQFIEELYKDMFISLSAYAFSALNDRSLAEEAVQDTFRIACVKVEELVSRENPKGWLMNTLKYVIRNIRRCRSRLNNLIISTLSLDDILVASSHDTESAGADIAYTDLLGHDDYTLLKLVVLQKYSMIEAAEEFGISVEVCKKRVQRAKKKLQKIFQEK